ncbi:MAG: ABC transporter permease, partial [Limisphaerales bacterium]
MFLLPVAAREVREASRQPRTYAWRAVTALIALILMAFIAWFTRYDSTQGQSLFIGVTIVAYLYCLLAGVLRTADVIAEEKRENTLGLLFLTDLKGWDIILGKLLSSSVNCLFGLLALIPMLAIPMLMGGVQWSEFICVVLSLINALLLSISWGFLISSLFRASVVTISTSLAIVIFLAVGVPFIAFFFDEKLNLKLLCGYIFAFSPTHCVIFGFDTSSPSYLPHYWFSLVFNFFMTLINLRLAIFFLPRFWQEVPKNKKTERWRERIRALRFGKAISKKRLRTRLLNQNPFYWLANREQVSSAGLMFISVFILLFGFATGVVAASGAWRGVEQIMISWMVSLALVHVIIAFRMAMSASYRLAEDRRSGALELLLGTEVSVQELLRGYWMALGRQFFGPAMIVFFSGIFAVLMMLMLFSDNVNAGNIVATTVEIIRRLFVHGADKEAGLVFIMVLSIQAMLALNWIALIWVGLWLGLREKRPGIATWTTLSIVFVPPWALLVCGVILLAEMAITRGFQPDEALTSLLVAGWILGGSNVVFLSLWARHNLLERFREAAADRYVGPRRIAWPKLRRIAIRFATIGVSIILVLYAARVWIDHRGEIAWQRAVAAHPNFQLAKEISIPSISNEKNLAKAPFIESFTGPNGESKWLTWNLSSRTRSGYNRAKIGWNWTQHRHADLGRIENTYVNLKVLKEGEGNSAARVLEVLAVYKPQLDELREAATARPLLQYKTGAFRNETHPPSGIFATPGFAGHDNFQQAILQLVQTLSVSTSAHLANGSTNLDDLFIALRFAEGFADQPESILEFHEAILDCVQPIYDGLCGHLWNNDQLLAIQNHFSSIDVWPGLDSFRENDLRNTMRVSNEIIRKRRDGRHSGPSWLARQAPVGFRYQWQADTFN